MSAPLVGSLITGAVTAGILLLSFYINSFVAVRLQRKLDRRAAIRLWQDDLYTLADIVNHVGAQGSWPGPYEFFWCPSSNEHTYPQIAAYVWRNAKREQDAWDAITAARRTAAFLTAKWQEDDRATHPSPPDMQTLRGAYDIIEYGRASLVRLDSSYRSPPRTWRDDCSVWRDITDAGVVRPFGP